jgi:Na+/H+ antiporter NhaD/arsenite permease-like protein
MDSLIFSFWSIAAIIVFSCAYILVVLEEPLELRKSKPVVLASGLIWLFIGISFAKLGKGDVAQAVAAETIGHYGELLLFLLVSITYVNVLEERRAFEALRTWLSGLGLSYRQLYWMIGAISFVLSIVLANMTTAMVMGAVALGAGRGNAKFITISFINIVVASNAGGAFCPFGDVTSLMVWQAGKLGFYEFFQLFLPALVNWLVPAIIMMFGLPKGGPEVATTKISAKPGTIIVLLLFALSVFLSVLVRNAYGLQPVIGMILGLGLLQAYSYYLQKNGKRHSNQDMVLDSFKEMQRIEWDTLLFFFGIMFAIGGLGLFGWLQLANSFLYQTLGSTVANIAIGPLSAFLDNVPLVYAVLQMNPTMNSGQWLLLTLAAGVGGSLLVIGSAAGIALMGMAHKQYTFMSHLKWSWAIALGYAAAIFVHLTLNKGLF